MAHTIKNISVMNGALAGVTTVNPVALFFPKWDRDGHLLDGDVTVHDDCAVIHMPSIADVKSDRVMGRFSKSKTPVILELSRWFLQYTHAGLYYMATPCEIRAYRRVLGQAGTLLSELALHFVYDRGAGTYISVMNSHSAQFLNYLRRINPRVAPSKALKSPNFLGLFYTMEAYNAALDRGRTLPKFQEAGQWNADRPLNDGCAWDGWALRNEALYQEYPTGNPDTDKLFERLEDLVSKYRMLRAEDVSDEYRERNLMLQNTIMGSAIAIYRKLTSTNPWFSKLTRLDNEDVVSDYIRSEYGEITIG